MIKTVQIFVLIIFISFRQDGGEVMVEYVMRHFIISIVFVIRSVCSIHGLVRSELRKIGNHTCWL